MPEWGWSCRYDQHPLLRRQPRHTPAARPRRVGGPRLPRPALQLQRQLQCAVQGAVRRGLPSPDQGLHRHLGVDAGGRAHLRAGDHHQSRHARKRQGDGLRLSPVHRQQRHDGLPRHDDAPPRRAAPRPQAHRLHLPPLRPDGQPLPQAAIWTRSVRRSNFRNEMFGSGRTVKGNWSRAAKLLAA